MRPEDIKCIDDLVKFSAESYGDKVFLKELCKEGVKETSFKSFYENARRVAAFLKKEAGDGEVRVGLIGTSSTGYLTCLIGTMLYGGVAVPIDPQLSAEEIADNLTRADVGICFYDSRLKRLAGPARDLCSGIRRFICLNGEEDELTDIISENEPMSAEGTSAGNCACILYTSGTTGKSKGVMLSQGNLVDNALCCENEADSSDVILSVLPIHHAYCLTCDYLLAIRYGVTVVINDSIMHIAKNIKEFEPTKILLVPMIVETIYRKIHAAHKSKPLIPMKLIGRSVFGKNLQCIFCGGAYLAPELIKEFKRMGVPLLQGYGMTECSPRITSSSLNNPTTGDEVGIIVKGCQVRIEDGEILVKSPSVMLGYYKNDEATKEMFTEDGWLKTGDLGYVKDNRLFLTGRKKNLIILSNGENISPEELENKFANLEWMQEILVYSEEEQITAEVYPFPEFKDKAEELFRKKVEQINKSVPPSKRIIRLRLRDREFDKTTSRKVKRIQTGEKGRLL